MADKPSVRCVRCKLIQYRTKSGYCRRCSVELPVPAADAIVKRFFVADPNEPSRIVVDESPTEVVAKIGKRIADVRERRGLNQNELQNLCKVSRSYLSRIESGYMTPSLATIEKVSESLGYPSLGEFFAPDYADRIPDPWIDELLPLLAALSPAIRPEAFARVAALARKIA